MLLLFLLEKPPQTYVSFLIEQFTKVKLPSKDEDIKLISEATRATIKHLLWF